MFSFKQLTIQGIVYTDNSIRLNRPVAREYSFRVHIELKYITEMYNHQNKFESSLGRNNSSMYTGGQKFGILILISLSLENKLKTKSKNLCLVKFEVLGYQKMTEIKSIVEDHRV